MLKKCAICLVSLLLIALQPIMSANIDHDLLLERVNSRLEVLTFANDVIFTRVKLFDRKIEKLLEVVVEKNRTIDALCYKEHEKTLKALLNGTEFIKLKQDAINKTLTNIEMSLKDEFNVNKSVKSRQKRQFHDIKAQPLIQQAATSADSDFGNKLSEILLKQNNLEAVFQLILEKSESSSTEKFIRDQFDDLKSFISSIINANEDEKNDVQELPLHDKHLNCLQNCDDAKNVFDSNDRATNFVACKDDVQLLKVANSTLTPFYASCTVGDWLIIQRREDGTVDFYRNWQDYKNGFGDVNNEYWIGLDRLHAITNTEPYELVVMLEDYNGYTARAGYTEFRVGAEADGYPLHVAGYYGRAGDSLSYHTNMKFSTYDNDNDNSTFNCARAYKGGWWYNCCFRSNLNGKYFSYADSKTPNGIIWDQAPQSLKFVSMAIRPYSLRFKYRHQCGQGIHEQPSSTSPAQLEISWNQN